MTALAKISNGANLPTLTHWVEDWFGKDLHSTLQGWNHSFTTPAVNIKESPDSFVVEMAAPGMKKSDFHVSFENNLLVIRSEVQESTNEDEKYTRREFGYYSFQRTFSLPDTVDGEKIKAQYTDGVLMLTIPKKEEARQKPARVIQIK